MIEKNIDHLNLDLDGDGELEKYHLQDTRVDGNLINYTYNNGKLSINGGLAYTKSSANNYSTEEKVIGTWVDGKPLYEKSFISLVSSYPNDTWVVVGNIENIDKVIQLTHSGHRQMNGHLDLSEYEMIEDSIRFNQTRGGEVTAENIIFTIQYTKTTDTTTIPVAEVLHNYSTEERIVGTWIDGKPIYEKTFISMVSSYPNDTWVVVGNIENANELIDWKVSGDLELSNLMSPGSLQIIGTDLRFVQKRGNTINCSNIKFTIQYTKN